MRQLTITIPDYFYGAFMEYFKQIPESSLLNESSFILTDKHVQILDESSAASSKDCLSREESNLKLKQGKNGL